MNLNAITKRIQWLNHVDTAEFELLENAQGFLGEQADLIDNTINVVEKQKPFSADCKVEEIEVPFSDEDFEGIQVSFEAIINMVLVCNGMDNYVNHFRWDGAPERKQTVRKLLLLRPCSRTFLSTLMRGTGSRGC